MRILTGRTLAVVFVALFFLSQFCAPKVPAMPTAQPAAAPAPFATPSPSPSPTPLPARPNLWPRGLARGTNKLPIGDFVPCMFDAQQEAEFRLILFNAQEQVTTAVQDQVNATKELPQDIKESINTAVAHTNFLSAEWEKPLTEALSSAHDKVEESVKTVRAPEDQSKAVEQAKKALDGLQATVPALVNKVLTGIERPNDVSCSMTVLPWDVAHDDFGRHLANKMIAIQVTVRNLNKDQEFLVHDVQIAVDTYPGMLNRFESGVNQPAVRGIVSIGQDISIRSWTVRLAEFLGAVAASSSITAGNDFKNGVAVYTGAFLPALRTLLPDHTVEQIGRLDEMTFSANNTRRVIVPTRSSVTFMTFISSQPLERIDFHCLYQLQTLGHVVPGECTASGADSGHKPWPFSSAPTADLPTYLRKKPKHYKSWSSVDLLALENSAYVIVAGAHIQEQPGVATLDSISCDPKTANGGLDVAKAADPAKPTDPVHCTLTGDQLQVVKTITLKNTANLSDPQTASGTVAVSGDPKHGDVTFKLADLKQLQASDYTVFFPDQNGISKSTTVHLVINPAAEASKSPAPAAPPDVKIQPTTIDLDKLTTGDFALTGDVANLDKVVIFKDATTFLSAPVTTIDAEKKTAKATFATNDLKSLTAGDHDVGVVRKGGDPNKPEKTKEAKLKVTKAAGPAPKPPNSAPRSGPAPPPKPSVTPKPPATPSPKLSPTATPH